MTARDALRTRNARLRTRPEGFGPVVGPDAWTLPPARQGMRETVPLDYALGCADPIEEEPQRLVVPAALNLMEWTLLGSILAMGALALWLGFGG